MKFAVQISFSNLTFFLFVPVATETPSQLFPLLSPFVVPLASSASGLGSAKPPKPLPRNHSQANPTRSRRLILLSTASLPPYSPLETLLPSPPPPQNPNHSKNDGPGTGFAQLPSTTSSTGGSIVVSSVTCHSTARPTASPSITL